MTAGKVVRFIAVAGIVAGCAPADRADEPAAVRANPSAGAKSDRGARLAMPSVVLGDDEANSDAQFEAITSATMLRSGRLAVGNGGSGEVFVFDKSGARKAVLAGEGGGPGESQTPMTISVLPSSGDGILVGDLNPWVPRLWHFSNGGSLVGEIVPPHAPPRSGLYWDVTMSPEGSMFALNLAGPGRYADNPTEDRPSAVVSSANSGTTSSGNSGTRDHHR